VLDFIDTAFGTERLDIEIGEVKDSRSIRTHRQESGGFDDTSTGGRNRTAREKALPAR